MSNQHPFRVVIGPLVNGADGFRIFSGDLELTDRVSVKSFELRVHGDDQRHTRATMEVFVDALEVELDPEHLRVDGVVDRVGVDRRVQPWTDLLAAVAKLDVLEDDLGGDPFDVDGGDVVVNARREVRIVCQAYNDRVLWIDPQTGQVFDDAVLPTWAEWAGEQLWFIRDDGDGWGFRSPFADKCQTNDPKPAAPEAPPEG